MHISGINQFIQYTFCLSPLWLGTLVVFLVDPAYGNPVVSNGFVRGLDGFLAPNLPALPSTDTANSDVSTISIKSSTAVNEQGASASISATATSSNGPPSQTEVSQVVPGATSISTKAIVQASNVLPNLTEATISSSPAQISNAPAPVSAVVPPSPAKAGATNTINSVASSVNTSAPVVISTPATTATPPIDQPTAILMTPLTRASTPLGFSSTFVAPFGNPFVTQTNTAIVQQQDESNELRSNNKPGFSYRIVGMPSRVWPGLGLIQISVNSK
jgi:hypothetical protein